MADLHTSSVDCAVAVPLNVQQQHLRHSTLLEYVRVYVCVCVCIALEIFMLFSLSSEKENLNSTKVYALELPTYRG